jgi:CRISPR/Cas system CSM-associated protein Csm3 (group 7 of RAMP superfamily)
MNVHWLHNRGIVERIHIEGDLVLETPAHFGGREASGLSDLPLFLDPLEGKALLTGSSLAGALRNHLRERELGYREKETNDCLAASLFGQLHDGEGEQSPLIVYDALGKEPTIELRDGVALDPKTRTAEPEKKYDIELLEAGTTFPVRLELLVTEKDRERLLRGLAIALQGLERGEIRLGARKRRGLGKCRVSKWRVRQYNLRTAQGLVGWLEDDQTPEEPEANIASLLQVPGTELCDARRLFTIEALFRLDSSLLIRSGSGQANDPDIVHLRSKRSDQEEPVPILSGTSLAGALRARALRIANTLGKDGKNTTDQMFGYRRKEGDPPTKPLTASRLWVDETVIQNPLELVQSRVKIDRFTGGSYPGALFSEQPVFGQLNGESLVRINLELRQPSRAKAGLLLLLLKDLWTGDLPLGGEVSVGRGRLHGEWAEIKYNDQIWRLAQKGEELIVEEGDKEILENFVKAFHQEGNDEA